MTNKTVMKKTYIAPCEKIADIELDALIATSPSIDGGPRVSQQSITDDNMDGYSMDTKRQNLWEGLW